MKNPPYVVYAGHYSGNKNPPVKQLPWHSHHCPEIVLMEKGKNLTHFRNAGTFECIPGTLLITPREIMHKQVDQPYCSLFYVGFEQEEISLDLSLRSISVTKDHFLRGWIHQIVTLFSEQGEIFQANCLLASVLMRLNKMEQERSFTEQKHPAICKAVKFISEHFCESLTAEQIAETSGISISRLNSLFQQNLGCSPMNLVMKRRMERACLLLKNPMLSVAEIAERISYQDPAYFIRLFHRECGKTPLAFRKQTLKSGMKRDACKTPSLSSLCCSE